ncbi:MAG: BrnT family toxin [Acidobacteriota bacterium]|nr:BrnT family toxin [Acidobacteriota bacterium]
MKSPVRRPAKRVTASKNQPEPRRLVAQANSGAASQQDINPSSMVAYTERGERIHIITARELTPNERKAYEQGDYL